MYLLLRTISLQVPFQQLLCIFESREDVFAEAILEARPWPVFAVELTEIAHDSCQKLVRVLLSAPVALLPPRDQPLNLRLHVVAFPPVCLIEYTMRMAMPFRRDGE